MWDPYAEFQSAVLPNGLTVHAAHWPGRPWQAMGFLIHSGAEHDPVGLEGLSHFVEHLVSENAGFPPKTISRFFKDYGGDARLGATGDHTVRLTFSVPAEQKVLARAFSMFGNMLFSAKIDRHIEEERAIIINEFHRRHSNPHSRQIRLRMLAALFPGYWLERAVGAIGTIESISRIAKDDLQRHYDAHYTPANMSIVGVGGMTLPELVELLAASPFAVEKSGSRTPLPTPTTDFAGPTETRHEFKISEHVTSDSPTVTANYETHARIPGSVSRPTVAIASDMFAARLTGQIRERRAWTYHVGCDYSYLGYFHHFIIACRSISPDVLDQIEEIIEASIASMMDREVLFKRVKRHHLAKFTMIDLSGGALRNGALNNLVHQHRITSFNEDRKEIERVTMDDICALLRWLKPAMRWTLVIRP